MTFKRHHSLLSHNTFGIDVNADYYLPYHKEEEIINVIPEIKRLNCKTLMVGEGSNLLFMNDFEGLILHSKIKDIQIVDQNKMHVYVRVGSGVICDDFIAWTIDHNFGGVENLTAIPGTIGAAPVQNVGAYGVEAKDVISKVETININTGEKTSFSNHDCQFAYRNSIFKNKLKGQHIVTYVTFKLDKEIKFNLTYGNIHTLLNGQKPSLKLIRSLIKDVRDQKLPDYKKLGNAGSFFTNPYITMEKYQELKKIFPDMPHYPVTETEVKIPAGWLIDQAKLKGYVHKRAGVHKDQALVLVNLGGATGQDIVELSDMIIAKVKEMFNITLHPEVNIIK